MKIKLIFLLLLGFPCLCFAENSTELKDFLENTYQKPQTEHEYIREQQEELWKTLSILEYYLKQDGELSDLLEIFNFYKNEFLEHRVNTIAISEQQFDAYTASYFLPDPKNYENPTIYYCLGIVDWPSRGISFLFRSISEFYYYQKFGSGEPIDKMLAQNYGELMQVRILQSFRDNMYDMSRYEDFLLSAFLNDENTLNSSYFMNRAVDPSIIELFETLNDDTVGRDNKISALNDTAERINHFGINGESLIQADDIPMGMNSYLRYVVVYSNYYFLDIYIEYLKSGELKNENISEILDVFLSQKDQLKKIAESDLDDFYELQYLFREKIYLW